MLNRPLTFMLLQDLQYPSDRLLVFFLRLGEDQDVVQIDHHDTLRYEVPEDVVHHGLEGGQTVGHSKEHYQGFEQISIGLEGCLPLISGLNVDVVETPADI